MLETELYRPVYDYLVRQGHTVHSEVKNCDITAVKGNELVVVEMKTSFNLKLLAQGVRRQRAADSVYLAIPVPRGGKRSPGWRDMCMLLRRLEMGLILVSPDTEHPVEIVFHPHTFDRLKSSRTGKKLRKDIIREAEARYADYNEGGSTRRKLMTAYRENSVFIACCLMKYGQLSPAQLKKLGTGNKTASILAKNYYGWFERAARGLYNLHARTEQDLGEYPELVKYYNEKIDNTNIDKKAVRP